MLELRVGNQHHSTDTSLTCEGDAALDEAARDAATAKLGSDRELGELELARTARQDGAGADDSILVERNEDLPAGIDEVRLRIGELRLLRVLHEVVLVEPRAVQFGETAGVLRPQGVDLDRHPTSCITGVSILYISMSESEDRHGRSHSVYGAVEIERVKIVVIRGDEQFPDSSGGSLLLQVGQQEPSDAFALMVASHGNVVDEHFGALGSSHWQRVRGNSANELVAIERGYRPKLLAGEEPVNVGVAKHFALLFKYVSHQGKQRPRQIAVARP